MDKSKRDIPIVMGLAGFILLVIVLIGIAITMSPPGENNENPVITSTTIPTYDKATTMSNPTATSNPKGVPTTLNSINSVKKLGISAYPDKFYGGDPNTMKFYAGDNLNLFVSDDKGNAVNGARIEFDNAYAGSTDEKGKFQIQNPEAGNHTLNALKDGYAGGELNISINKYMYAMSTAVNRILDSDTRSKYIADNRANLRFYYLPNCTLCKIMEPKVAKIVNEHRDCIVYEHISMWIYYNHPEIKNQFADKLTPVIRIVGSKANYETQGLVAPESLIDMITNAAPECMKQ